MLFSWDNSPWHHSRVRSRHEVVIVPNLPGFLRLFREIWLMQFRPSATTNLAHFWVSPGCLRRSSPADSDEVLLAYARGGMPSLSRFEET